MIGGEVPLSNIIEYYQEATRENVILLILRCKKMYEARLQVKRIIKMLIMLEDMLTKSQPLLTKLTGFTPTDIEELRSLQRHVQKLDG